jgi:hypothetical protein
MIDEGVQTDTFSDLKSSTGRTRLWKSQEVKTDDRNNNNISGTSKTKPTLAVVAADDVDELLSISDSVSQIQESLRILGAPIDSPAPRRHSAAEEHGFLLVDPLDSKHNLLPSQTAASQTELKPPPVAMKKNESQEFIILEN